MFPLMFPPPAAGSLGDLPRPEPRPEPRAGRWVLSQHWRLCRCHLLWHLWGHLQRLARPREPVAGGRCQLQV